uniref:Uncharacterized protein n=1 Tax=Anguilla anguilla TaxID=7936 RepID=A0A0E9WRW6_ANGAN
MKFQTNSSIASVTSKACKYCKWLNHIFSAKTTHSTRKVTLTVRQTSQLLKLAVNSGVKLSWKRTHALVFF